MTDPVLRLADEALEMAGKATVGPWDKTANGGIKAWLEPSEDVPGFRSIAETIYRRDAEFIAYAREAVPRLASALRELHKRCGHREIVLEAALSWGDELHEKNEVLQETLKRSGERREYAETQTSKSWHHIKQLEAENERLREDRNDFMVGTREEAKKHEAEMRELRDQYSMIYNENERLREALVEVKRLAPQLHSYAFGQNRYADEVLLQIGEKAAAALRTEEGEK